MSGQDVGRKIGGFLGGVLKESNPIGGLAKEAFDKASAYNNPLDGKPEMVVRMRVGREDKLVRVDEKKDGTYKAKVLSPEELQRNPEYLQTAKTPAEIQTALRNENTKPKTDALVKYVNDTDAYIAGKTGREAQEPMKAGATPAETREQAIGRLKEDLKEIDKIPKDQMSKDEKKQFKESVSGEIGRLDGLNDTSAILQAAATAANPAAAAPAPAAPSAKPGFPTPGG